MLPLNKKFKAVGSAELCLRVILNFKRHFLSTSFHSSKNPSLNIHLLLKRKCHMGVRKITKKCHVLFEWPLTLFNNRAWQRWASFLLEKLCQIQSLKICNNFSVSLMAIKIILLVVNYSAFVDFQMLLKNMSSSFFLLYELFPLQLGPISS